LTIGDEERKEKKWQAVEGGSPPFSPGPRRGRGVGDLEPSKATGGKRRKEKNRENHPTEIVEPTTVGGRGTVDERWARYCR